MVHYKCWGPVVVGLRFEVFVPLGIGKVKVFHSLEKDETGVWAGLYAGLQKSGYFSEFLP